MGKNKAQECDSNVNDPSEKQVGQKKPASKGKTKTNDATRATQDEPHEFKWNNNWSKFKDSGCALSSTPSSILLSDLSNEQMRNPRKALLLSLLLKSCTRLQHPFV
jgi:hypothetical protein